MFGSIYKMTVHGLILTGLFTRLVKIRLSLYFDANDIDIFLQPLCRNIAKNIKGSGFGNVHLFGPFSKLTQK